MFFKKNHDTINDKKGQTQIFLNKNKTMLRIHKKKTIISGLASLITIAAVSVPVISTISKAISASALETIIYTKGGIDLTVRIDEESDNYDVNTIQIDGVDMANYCFTEPTKSNVLIRSSCLDFLTTGSRHSFVIKTRHSDSANTHSFDFELSVISAAQVEVGAIGGHFNKDYSRGILYRNQAVTVNSSNVSTMPFELVGFSSTINNCHWEDSYACASNKWKNTGKISKITRGAVYNNEYLDVIEYTWKDNFASPQNNIVYDNITAIYGKSSNNGTSISNARVNDDTPDPDPVRDEMTSKKTLAYTHREFHFYKTGTNFTQEVNFKGVVAFGDFEYAEGYVFKQGQKKVYVDGWGDSSQWASSSIAGINGFVRPFSYPDSSQSEIMLYAEVESTAFSPLHVVYVTPADRNRGSNSMVQAAYVRYNLVGTVPSGVSAPAYDTVVKGGTITPTAAPSVTGYTFSGWYTNEAMTTPAGSDVYVDSDVNLYGKYTRNVYNITASAVNGTTSGNISNINHGTSRTVTYNCNTGYHLASITVDGAAVSITNFPSSYAFNNVTANHTIAVVCEINTYDITTNIEHGTITDPISKTPYGSTQKIEYSCEPKYHVASAIVDGVTNVTETNPTDYTFSDIKDNHDISVVCEHDPLKVETSIENGDITPSDETVIYETDFKVDYNCNTGFSLESVTVNGEPVDKETFKDSYQFIKLQEDATVAVVCKEIPVGVETSIENGEITGSNYEIGYGEDFTVKYTCTDGNAPLSIKVNDEEVSVKDFPSEYGFKELTNFQKIDVICAEPKETSVITPDTGALTSQYQEENGVMDYVLTGIMVLAGCTGTALLIKFCLHSRDMKSDRQN